MYKLLLVEPQREPPREVVVAETDASRSFRVVQAFSPRLVLVDAPADVRGLESTEDVKSAPLGDDERLAASAWLAGSTPGAPPARAPKPWSEFGEDAPAFFHEPAAPGLFDASNKAFQPPFAGRSMTGRIAVGIVFVSGASSGLRLSENDQRAVLSQVQKGLQFLATEGRRARVIFDYDVRHVTVQVPPRTVLQVRDKHERLEAPWRDAALRELGYGPGREGWRAYASDIRDARSARWSYVAFFTRYDLHHHAYTDDDKVVMSTESTSSDPDWLCKVFAHETCHVFGAADEYGNCSCTSRHGVFQVSNGNCRACGPTQSSCLMNEDVLELCDHSRRQLGWEAPNVA